MLHLDSGTVSSVLSEIYEEYGNISKITITQGKIHKCLGVTINYSSPGKVKFYMVDYVGNMLDETPEEMSE